MCQKIAAFMKKRNILKNNNPPSIHFVIVFFNIVNLLFIKMHTPVAPANYNISLDKQILCFELSPYELSSNVFCAALMNKIVIGTIQFPEENENCEFEWKRLRELDQETRCHAIKLAPETTLSLLPKQIKFCTAGADFRVRIYRTNLENSDTVQAVNTHKSYVNDLSWEPKTGKYLASVSDDHTCQVRRQHDDFKTEIVFRFKSPGMIVRWHPDDNDKLLVAEKRGTIHIYNVEKRQITFSIEHSKSPLMSADWCPRNHFHIIALGAGEATLFDLRCPYRPAENKMLHEDGGLVVKYSPNAEHIVASIGRPDVTMVVSHLKSELPLLVAQLKLFGGLSWHARLPYICVADDGKLLFWKTLMK